ncbi:hypothetical protein H310_08415 [Aphanomyces invadans]|uniref:Amino acid transporter n=1 Tax=Aphanomyces invadans TaxID=157072 RepID=A0A024U025_9STRA|nr:hypothetical protein H310_08415 [Aphanomyces invadans]ETV98927.1 hypothetical protein H310_08415 [Aphanomyces invadans]RHY27182.1 hypothetical protein DYB32_006982 [Aphanomyces invadans]|eukprot:XP_008872355.1 hypothetical protein H310_08415 [Aphanomyces invadans]
MGSPNRQSKKGILLFEESPRPQRFSYKSNPSSKPSSGKRAPANAPHDSGYVRTNFMSAQPLTNVMPSNPYDSYFETPVLEHTETTSTGSIKSKQTEFAAPQFQSFYVVIGAFLGIGVGFGMYYLHIGTELEKALTLPGDLFVRALRCLIVPLVFCVMTIVVTESVCLGRSSIMRLRTLLPYIASSVVSTVQGTVLALLFKDYFVPRGPRGTADGAASTGALFNLTLQCANGKLLTLLANGTLGCVATNATAPALFLAANHTMATTTSTTITIVDHQLSLVDHIVAICNLLVPGNIFQSLVDGSLLSIVMFSFPLGVALAQSAPNGADNVVLNCVRQLRNIFVQLLNGLLTITPVAVVFLMGGAIAKVDQQDISEVISQMGYLFLAFMIGAVSHAIVVLPLVVYLWVKVNPYTYLQQLIPAYVFAFGCASSMATLPVAIECIQRTKVSRSLAHIAMPFGTPVNLNASGIYYPLAVVFMATMSGHGDLLTPVRFCVIFFVSLLGSIGTAPVPNAGLVYVMTLWKTCFPTVDLPITFSLIVTADILLDRLSTVLNVNGNAMATRILAEQIDETFEVQADRRV